MIEYPPCTNESTMLDTELRTHGATVFDPSGYPCVLNRLKQQPLRTACDLLLTACRTVSIAADISGQLFSQLSNTGVRLRWLMHCQTV